MFCVLRTDKKAMHISQSCAMWPRRSRDDVGDMDDMRVWLCLLNHMRKCFGQVFVWMEKRRHGKWKMYAICSKCFLNPEKINTFIFYLNWIKPTQPEIYFIINVCGLFCIIYFLFLIKYCKYNYFRLTKIVFYNA